MQRTLVLSVLIKGPHTDILNAATNCNTIEQYAPLKGHVFYPDDRVGDHEWPLQIIATEKRAIRNIHNIRILSENQSTQIEATIESVFSIVLIDDGIVIVPKLI